MNSITELIINALQKAGAPGATLEFPSDLSHGDYASNVAFTLASGGKNPKEIAAELVQKLPRIPGVSEITVAGPGFINFMLDREYFTDVSKHIGKSGDSWGENFLLSGKRVMVEYTDPNPFKELHIGHLVPNAIGESLSRLFLFSGAEVKRVTFQGDVGLHVAKALWGMQRIGEVSTAFHLGQAYAMGAKAYEEDATATQEIKDINKKVYEREDEQLMALYERGKKISLEYFKEAYDVLGSTFDRFFFESETGSIGKAKVLEHVGSIFKESDGAIIFPGEEHGLHTRVFVTRDGLPTYEAKDIGLVEKKAEYFPFDISVTVTASEQKEYFRVVQKAIELVLPEYKGKIEVVINGMLRLKEGKMSSRTGEVVVALALVNEVAERVGERMEEGDVSVAKNIAVGAIKYAILKSQAGKDIVFDFKESIAFEGNSGPYLQYTYARAKSVLNKAKEVGVLASTTAPNEPYSIERLLHQFPSAVERAMKEREPHHVATFATDLAGVFNTFYAQEKIADATDIYAGYKVLLTSAVAQTLKNALYLLGIEAPERM